MKRPSRAGFTLVELIAVVAIIGMLITLAIPHYQSYIEKARSAVCMNNLRQIGLGVLGYVGDNDNSYPIIEPNPDDPVYVGADGEAYTKDDPNNPIKPLAEALEPYGVTANVLKCPADLAGENAGGKVYYYDRNPNTSYEWYPIIDTENAVAPKIYGGRRGNMVRVVKPSRVRICTDFEAIHFGHLNRLYADGHVKATLADPVAH